jgi:hypothetical protein
MSCLVAAHFALFFEHRDLHAEHPLSQPVRRGQPDDAASDDDDLHSYQDSGDREPQSLRQ